MVKQTWAAQLLSSRTLTSDPFSKLSISHARDSNEIFFKTPQRLNRTTPNLPEAPDDPE
jgi:hypothetical protein